MNDTADLDDLFEDENNLREEMSDKEVKNHVEELKEKRENSPTNYGRDGSLEVYSETFEYRDVSFKIVVRRYFKISPLDIDAEMSDGTSKWARLKPVDNSEDAATFLSKYNIKIGFLNHHTTHSWNEGMSLKERFEECVEEAEKDINWFRDSAGYELEERIDRMKEGFEGLE